MTSKPANIKRALVIRHAIARQYSSFFLFRLSRSASTHLLACHAHPCPPPLIQDHQKALAVVYQKYSMLDPVAGKPSFGLEEWKVGRNSRNVASGEQGQ